MIRKYVARQVIVDNRERPYAYELLYQSAKGGEDSDTVTKDLVSTLSVDFATDELTQGRRAFVKFPKAALMSKALLYLEAGNYVLELEDDVAVDNRLEEQLAMLRRKHYQFAISGFTGGKKYEKIETHISFIKVDIKTPVETQKEIIAEYKKKKRKKMLAERIESEEEFTLAKELGYELFQGHYFAQPTLIIRESIGFSQSAVIMLLRELHEEDPDYNKVDRIINTDAGLTYRLLARGNTMAFAGKMKFTNPAQVVVRMGIEELQRWSTLLLMQESAEPGQEEKMELALLRALFIESLAVKMDPDLSRQDRYYIYLKGMFSIFPTHTRDEVFQAMDFTPDLELVDTANDLLTFNYAYEMGDYDMVDIYLQEKQITDGVVLGCYKSAISNANAALRS